MNRLPVPYHAQGGKYWCAAACTQMFLAYHGPVMTQSALADHLQTSDRSGTPLLNLVRFLRHLNFEMTVQANGNRRQVQEFRHAGAALARPPTTEADLMASLQEGQPVFVAVDLARLPGRQRLPPALHLVLATGLDAHAIAYHDPYNFDRLGGPREWSLRSFLRAAAPTGGTAIFARPRR